MCRTCRLPSAPYLAKAVCPQCGRPLRFTRGTMRSECGWKLRIT